ncbi:hypothetical protein, partial [Limosilactobacillus fermentum]|uniref:hypothetical protein n=1 Tax=Limosilactobacillus fermentum TaxID=1613 RepID=UPI001962DDEE
IFTIFSIASAFNDHRKAPGIITKSERFSFSTSVVVNGNSSFCILDVYIQRTGVFYTLPIPFW